jgi:Dolichyl-phosphate-mannose-protein mannosyltransferase
MLGCGARAYHYFLNPSLNHDDAALALNIIQRGVWDLRGALDYVQLAPWGFLLLERAVASTIGVSELALRLVPFLASVVSVPAFWFLASRRLHPLGAALATGFFAMSQDLTGASLQVKQYSIEILMAILLLTTSRALFIEDGSIKRRDWIIAAIAGAGAVWFSFSSVFVLAAIGLASLYRRPRRELRRVVAVGSAWVGSGLLYATVILRHQLRGSRMFSVWDQAFPPPSVAEWPAWILGALLSLGAVTTSVRLAPFTLVALVFAVGLTCKSPRRFTLALALTVVITLFAASLSWYPFVGRFLFFAAPAVLLLVFTSIGRWSHGQSKATRRGLCLAAFVALTYSTVSFARHAFLMDPGFDDPRGAYEHIRQHLREGDLLYASPAATPSLLYYDAALARLQTPPSAWPAREARVWFVFFGPTEEGFDDRAIKAADRRGMRVASVRRKHHSATVWQLTPRAAPRGQ